jgi:hypothetical protein
MKSTGSGSLNYEGLFIQEQHSSEVEGVEVQQWDCGFESRRQLEISTESFSKKNP